MQPKTTRYELKFGEAHVTVRRTGSMHVLTARILGTEPSADGERVRVWLDRRTFDEPEVEQEDWRAYGAVSTILDVPACMLTRQSEDVGAA